MNKPLTYFTNPSFTNPPFTNPCLTNPCFTKIHLLKIHVLQVHVYVLQYVRKLYAGFAPEFDWPYLRIQNTQSLNEQLPLNVKAELFSSFM